MFNTNYQSPEAIQAWQRTSPRYELLTRICRALLSIGLVTGQLPLIVLDSIFRTNYYGKSSWSFLFRFVRLASNHYIWSANPGTRPPADVTSTAARSSTSGLRSGQCATLVNVAPRPDMLFGDALHKNVEPQSCPCFWMWLAASMKDPSADPRPSMERKVVMYFVGGGMVQGHPVKSPLPWKVMASTGIPIFGVNFRKCVTARDAFPAALQDAVAVFYYLLEQGYLAENISIMGDSGGGGIVVTTVLYLLRHKLKVPGSTILISPWVDLVSHFDDNKELLKLDMLNPEMLSFASYQYVENRPDLRSTLLSPSLNQLPAGYSMEGFPKTLLCYGDTEMFAPSNAAFAENLRKLGVEVDELIGKDEIHVYPYFSKERGPQSFYGRVATLLGRDGADQPRPRL